MSRQVKIVRETAETRIEVEIDLDNLGQIEVNTPVPFFNHMLHTFLFYMNSSARVIAIDKKNYDDHHVIEDTAIALGEAIKRALGDKRGIKRFSTHIVPMDEALVLTSIDISNRGLSFVDLNLKRDVIGGLATENVKHFIQSLAYNSGITIHVIQLRGENTHHIIEATFKGLGMCIYDASRIIFGEVRSTKGSL
ncbi:MAG: imidazoleglycerol-phosphate dehydratase [Sulfolobaceae archaeon]